MGRNEITVRLPGDAVPGGSASGDPIILHEYNAPPGSVIRQKGILGMHAISLVISGEKTIRFAERAVRTNDREIHLLAAGNCLVTMDLSGQNSFHSILLFFDDRVLVDFYRKYASLIDRAKKGREIPRQSYLSLPKDPFINGYIGSLELMVRSGKKPSLEMKLLKFEELMLHLLENFPASMLGFKPGQKMGPDEEVIRNAVSANILSNISVEELAFLCNMSISTFKRKFARIYGSSPNKWILLRRMELAKDLLLSQNEKPGEVYHKIGYESHSSFSQSFKQVYGITPKDFRQQQFELLPKT